jgi:hypothetical protein
MNKLMNQSVFSTPEGARGAEGYLLYLGAPEGGAFYYLKFKRS